MSSRVLRVDREPDPAKRLRNEMAASLAEHLEAQGIARKELRDRLARLDPPIKVSRQAIDQWVTGAWTPKPYHQAAIALVLKVPVHRLFPIAQVAS